MMVVMVAVMMIRNPVVPFWNIAFCLIKFFNSKAHFVAFNSLLYASCTAIIPVIHCPFFLSIKELSSKCKVLALLTHFKSAAFS